VTDVVDNERRASFGRAAVDVGTPDVGKNGADLDGVRTDVVDTIANALHYLAIETLRVKPGDVETAEMVAMSALDGASIHFRAELRGDEPTTREQVEALVAADPDGQPLVEIDLGPGLADHGTVIAVDDAGVTLEDATGQETIHPWGDVDGVEGIDV
jgi:hypothetical protein